MGFKPEFDPQDQALAALHEVERTMEGESDRGCVLVGASLIEWRMGELLMYVFLDMHEEWTNEIRKQIKVMLNPTSEKSILGTAAARARMCRVLGLIGEPEHRLLREFFIFRNEHFAHARSDVKLTDKKIKKSLLKLVKLVPTKEMQLWFDDDCDEREILIRLVVTIYYFLDSADYVNKKYQAPSS